MRFDVKAAEYYGRGTPDPNSFLGPSFVTMVERPIKQLVARYHLAGKSILSLGAGAAFEEYWMSQAGARLTLNDLDAAHGHIRPYLETLPAGDLTYYLEDAAETIRFVERHDVLYVSSFHPDEIRREEIVARHGGWPIGESPYHELLLNAMGCVKPNGLVIFQHYRGGVDPSTSPHYILAVRDALNVRGITLADAYVFRQAPTKLLIVGFRGEPPDFGPEITEFHGRYPYEWIRRDVVKVYDYRRGVIPFAPPSTLERTRRRFVNAVRRALASTFAPAAAMN
ncbi:MAG: hypothetical protein NT123_25405 [Proteobacteria bacterium]|nr:hypothetical protein [Pseudomonadota bacterium]